MQRRATIGNPSPPTFAPAQSAPTQFSTLKLLERAPYPIYNIRNGIK